MGEEGEVRPLVLRASGALNRGDGVVGVELSVGHGVHEHAGGPVAMNRSQDQIASTNQHLYTGTGTSGASSTARVGG